MLKLFGLLGAERAQSDADDWQHYVQSAAGTAAPADAVSVARAGGSCAMIAAPGVACSEGLLVAVRGRPFWRGSPEVVARNGFAAEILAAYRREGSALLSRLYGSFAVAIVDAGPQRALLAIDRMGIERLAYARHQGCLLFSTSAEAVARGPGSSPTLDSQALFDYLFFHFIPAPRTVFRGVEKLPAGHLAEFERGDLAVSRYWNPEIVDSGPAESETLGIRLRNSLRTAVSATQPGKESGAFLSGGLDSSTVAGVLAEVVSPPAKTFSIGFGYPDYDELPYARIANRRFGCQGHEFNVHGSDIAESFPLIASAYDEPFGNSSALPVYHCALLAKRSGVNHLLAGDGGDELFAGNSRYAEQQIFEWYSQVPPFLRRHVLEAGLAAIPAAVNPWLIRKARGYIGQAQVPLPDRLENWNLVYRLGAAQILDPEFLAAIDPRAPLSHMQSVWNDAPCNSSLKKMLWYDWRFTLADNDLRKVESMCELAGIEVSYPMLHPDVVDLSCEVPPQLLMPGRKLRHFYKQSMRGLLPDEIIHKTKHGFGLPFGLWLQESAQLRELIFGNLSQLRSRRMVRPEFIDRLVKLHGTDDARYYGVFIWVLAMLEQWFNEHSMSH